MNSIDEKMLDMLNNTSLLDQLKKENSKLKKDAFRNYHFVLLKKWLIIISVAFIGVFLGLAVSYVAPPVVSTTGQISLSTLTPTIIGPSITINGLFITLTPVISFFFLSEIKEMDKESKMDREKLRSNITDNKEAITELDKLINYEHAFSYNLRCGVLSYVRTYVYIALTSLFILLATYLLNPALFFIADLLVLAVLLTGIFPVLSVALLDQS